MQGLGRGAKLAMQLTVDVARRVEDVVAGEREERVCTTCLQAQVSRFPRTSKRGSVLWEDEQWQR